MDKILFLDFDGVLFDTLIEVYLVNRALYLKKSLFDKIEDDIYLRFSKYKYLVYNIWMFYYYNPLIFSSDDIDIEKEFQKALLKRDIKKEEEFCSEFLKIRSDLVKNHYDFWANLEKPFDFFYEIKELYEKDNISLAIVSKKNKISIKQRFESFGFNLNPDLIFAREILDKYPSKAEFMVEFMQKEGCKSAIFVDDNENNLEPVKKYKNIETILALWGNTKPDSKGLGQSDAINKIKNYFR